MSLQPRADAPRLYSHRSSLCSSLSCPGKKDDEPMSQPARQTDSYRKQSSKLRFMWRLLVFYFETGPSRGSNPRRQHGLEVGTQHWQYIALHPTMLANIVFSQNERAGRSFGEREVCSAAESWRRSVVHASLHLLTYQSAAPWNRVYFSSYFSTLSQFYGRPTAVLLTREPRRSSLLLLNLPSLTARMIPKGHHDTHHVQDRRNP